jgi:hypothetical protein
LGGSTTCLYYAPFYDEDGERHHHDGNIRTMGYRCSNSHRWEEKSVASCWCGWGTPKGDAGPATPKKGEVPR